MGLLIMCVFLTILSIGIWVWIARLEDNDEGRFVAAMFIAGTLGGPILLPILTIISWWLYIRSS
jgi:hypothetical protein